MRACLMEKAIAMGYNEMTKDEKRNLERKLEKEDEKFKWTSLEKAANAKEWQKLCMLIKAFPGIMGESFERYYKVIPDEMKYDFVTSIYTQNVDRFTNIRKALTEIRRYGAPKLPEWMNGVITIYRGDSGSAKDAIKRISWTIDKDVAEFFANRKANKYFDEGHVYEGKINTEDIIAFSNVRKEQEVMQYDKVFGVHEVFFEPGRITTLD